MPSRSKASGSFPFALFTLKLPLISDFCNFSVVLVVVYLIHGEIIVGKFNNLTTGILTIVASVLYLVNLIMAVLYLRD